MAFAHLPPASRPPFVSSLRSLISVRFLRQSALGGTCVAATFALFVAALWTYHHPVLGFTRFLQLEQRWADVALPEIATAPVHIYTNTTGYDGQFYAQLALRPTLQDPQLSTALDNAPLRARRPLVSWMAALIGMGDTARVLHAYAWINVVGWFVFAVLLLRLFPPNSAHHLVAWFGLVASCGVLTSVRYALTDLPALLLILLAMTRKPGAASSAAARLLALASLARETSVLSGIVLLDGSWRARIQRGLILVIPLFLWLFYVRATLGSEQQSLGNFDWPGLSLAGKMGEVIAGVIRTPQDLIAWAALGCMIGLGTQAAWLLWRRDIRNPWWQLGVVYLVLLVFLGWPTFAGFPAATTRILLPLHLAFNRLVPATRAGLAWLILGNLSVLGGFVMMRGGNRIPGEIVAAKVHGHGYTVYQGAGWFGLESDKNHEWLWTSQRADLELRRFTSSPLQSSAPVFLRFDLVGFVACEVEIRQEESVLWRGLAPRGGRPIELAAQAIHWNDLGRARITFVTSDAPAPESPYPDARHLAFAIYDPKITPWSESANETTRP